MPTSSTAYGSTLPSGSDPYPIESVLAKIVGENNPAEAANMLDVYQAQRLSDTGNYNYALSQQHDFAKQQLAQQLQENYMKNAIEAAKTPGGLTLLGGLSGGAALGGVDPTQLETNLRAAQAASTAKDAATAAYQGVEAGTPPDVPTLSAMTGGLLNTQGVPLALQKEAMVQSGADRRHGADAGGVGISIPMNMPPALGGGQMTVAGGKRLTAAQIDANLRGRGFGGLPQAPGALPTPGGGSTTTAPTPDASTGTVGGGPTTPSPAVAPRGSTSLAPAPGPRATAAPGQPSGAQIRQAVEAHVENNVRIRNPTAYADIVAGKVGGKVNIVGTAPDGRPIIQGKNGRYVP
jgi:hypothetical protein